MKSTERHKLKENEFARTVAQRARRCTTRPQEVDDHRDRRDRRCALVAADTSPGGASRATRKATTCWPSALAVVRSAGRGAAAAGARQRAARSSSPAPSAPSRRGSRPRCRSLQRGRRRVSRHRRRHHRALPRSPASLAELGRYAEAEQRYQEVVAEGRANEHLRTTPRGWALGEAQLAQGKVDDSAITTFQELATDTNSQLPVDGVLMQLGRAS